MFIWKKPRIIAFGHGLAFLLIALALAIDISACVIMTKTPEASTDRSPWESEMSVFPWPPPSASSIEVLPASLVMPGGQDFTMGDVNKKLITALSSQGYYSRSYFEIPDGFALVTKLEAFESDGRSANAAIRFIPVSESAPAFDFADYIRALFTAQPGHYRIIVFLITPKRFYQASAPPSEIEAQTWLGKGLNDLPDEVARRPYPAACLTTAYIYEFERPEGATDVIPRQPGILDAHTHLVRSGIWGALQ